MSVKVIWFNLLLSKYSGLELLASFTRNEFPLTQVMQQISDYFYLHAKIGRSESEKHKET
jgi:hypothetical protein